MADAALRLIRFLGDEGVLMRKLNTYTLYDLARNMRPLTELTHTEDMTLADVAWTLVTARYSLQWFRKEGSIFSPSLKRAAGALLDAIRELGIPDVLPWEGEGGTSYDPKQVFQSWQISNLSQSAKDFETVIANELPGLAIYHVLQKGIYATDDLLAQADRHLPDAIRKALAPKASQDICESGKCLAFELSTASAFHMWRALETVMDAYYESLTGQTFEAADVTRNWGSYIKALEKACAETKITTFLNHIREEYRNPITHPSATLEPEEAFSLFSAGLSAITQAMKATMVETEKRKALAKAASVALSAAASASSIP